ncbi:DMT family transporter [Motiliproteus sediminis]|uniref:DMT family transporter n=1 Tax=Motiliproteus sediminis TaxID=1468178 RepID=UPI001AEF7E3D|nr:EamA family transporter [Motiliproteus sediminis]
MNNLTLYITTVLIWGSTWIAITFQLGPVDPLLSVGYRFLLAALLLLGYSHVAGKKLRFTRREHLFMALQGGLLFGLNYWLFYLTTAALTSGLVAVIFSTVVFMNMVNGRLWLGRSIQPHVVIAATIGLTGIVLVFWPELAQADSATTLGALLLGLLATYLASLGNILSARNQQCGLPVMQTNAYGMAYGGGLMLLMAVAGGTPLTFSVELTYLLSLLYLSLFGSIVAFGCYLTLIGRIGADRAAYAGLLFPVVALQLSAWFESYQWTPLSLTGLGMVLLGNLLMLTPPTRFRQLLSRSVRARGVTGETTL